MSNLIFAVVFFLMLTAGGYFGRSEFRNRRKGNLYFIASIAIGALLAVAFIIKPMLRNPLISGTVIILTTATMISGVRLWRKRKEE